MLYLLLLSVFDRKDPAIVCGFEAERGAQVCFGLRTAEIMHLDLAVDSSYMQFTS